MAHDILIVDDEADIRTIVSDLLKDEGYSTRCATDGPNAVEAICNRRPNLVLLDIWLGDSRFDGMKVLETLCQNHPSVPVVMMSGHGNIETAVTAIKKGAYDFIEKPFKADRLFLVVKRAIEASRLRYENQELKTKVNQDTQLTGSSHYVNQLRQTITKVAPSNSRVFIIGPSGAGKEIFARQIHSQSNRSNGPFMVMNCSTVNSELFEQELFGVESNDVKNIGQQTGILEQAHLGTLLLDEVTYMPIPTQGKVARTLQDNTFKRVGGDRKIEVDVRVIATSSNDLGLAIAEGRLREDLFYRLNVVPITIQALRNHKEDIPVLAEHFLEAASKATGQPKRQLREEAITALQTYEWPGNIRQLRNVIEWVLIMSNGGPEDLITIDMLPSEVIANLPVAPHWEGSHDILKLPLRNAREVFERQYLLSQVSRFSGNISQTANFIGMERSALHRKLRALGVDRTGTGG